MSQITVLHALRYDSRTTTSHHALCFGRYSKGHKIEYVNIFGLIPSDLDSDVVILTYDLLALRRQPIWNLLVKRMGPILKQSSYRIAMPQDDYSRCAVLDSFISKYKIGTVLTPITRDLQLLYPHSLAAGVHFEEAMTGYFDEDSWSSCWQFAKPFMARTIDLGQRVWHLSPQFGIEAGRKAELAIKFSTQAQSSGFVCDVSTNPADVFIGDDWYKFLGNCKFTISRKGGASIADPSDRIANRFRRFQLRHPNATMDEMGQKVSFRGGRQGDFSAISPRLFECAALGVCQILELGEYVEGLEPWTHYIPLEQNFSNIQQIFQVMRDIDRCEAIAEASQEPLLKNPKNTYSYLVDRVLLAGGAQSGPNESSICSDSSNQLGQDILDAETLMWVQSYVARAFLKRKNAQAIRSLSAGLLLKLDATDKPWENWAQLNADTIIRWIEAFESRQLIVESLVVPWTVARL